MWFRLLSRDGRGWTMRLGAAVGAALALAMAGCSADYVEDGQAPFYLRSGRSTRVPSSTPTFANGRVQLPRS